MVVDESLVRKLFPQTDPIGKRIAFEFSGHSAADWHPTWREIVGVVRHVRHYGIAGEPPFVQLYTPFEQLPRYMQPRSPAMALYAWIVAVVGAVALLASYLPARRATWVDPLLALRAE